MEIKKREFEVYLTTGEIITVLAERWEIDYSDKRRIAFHTDGEIVSFFMLEGICGFKEV